MKSRFPLTELITDMMDVPSARLIETNIPALAKHYGVREDWARWYRDQELTRRLSLR